MRTRDRRIVGLIVLLCLISGTANTLCASNDDRGLLAGSTSPDAVHETQMRALRQWWYSGARELPEGIPKDLPQWVATHPKDARAAFYLSVAYSSPLPGFKMDKAAAKQLARTASDLGQIPATSRLGIFLAVDPSPDKHQQGLRLLEQSMELHDSDAYVYMGFLELQGKVGDGTPQLAAADRHLHAALALGNVKAYAFLALRYQLGNDSSKAIETLRAGVAAGDRSSMTVLANFLRTGVLVEKKDIRQAFQLMQRAASFADPQAEGLLADMYASGEGTGPNAEKAFFLYQSGAEAGDVHSKWKLGQAYLTGSGTQRDIAAALRIDRELADAGDAEACYVMGAFYLEGLVVDRDLAKAHDMFARAAKAGSASGALYLQLMALRKAAPSTAATKPEK